MKIFSTVAKIRSRCSFKEHLFLTLSASCLALSLICFTAWTREKEERVAEALAPQVLRFHVLADSDAPEDQALKLQVRDLLLHEIRRSVPSRSDKEQIQRYIEGHESELEQAANTFIKEQGFSCTADIRLEQAYFPTRVYGDLTFPCGVYDAVRVVIGSGNGHNWWCVLYPSLCFTSESFAVMPPESEEELSGLLDESLFEELHKERNLVFGESVGTPPAESQVKIKPDFYFLRWIRK
ncbi:MAG: stage II sporulation protein R [Clostridium sp.]|nr:stage II sporulation protein R [Clostridium sp.]